MQESSTEKLPLTGKALQEFRDKSFDWFLGLVQNSNETTEKETELKRA